MISFTPSADELKRYRDETGVGLTDAKDQLTKLKMIEHLQNGGASEPVLLYLLRDWAKVK